MIPKLARQLTNTYARGFDEGQQAERERVLALAEKSRIKHQGDRSIRAVLDALLAAIQRGDQPAKGIDQEITAKEMREHAARIDALNQQDADNWEYVRDDQPKEQE